MMVKWSVGVVGKPQITTLDSFDSSLRGTPIESMATTPNPARLHLQTCIS